VKLVEQFLRDLDRDWEPTQKGKIPLSIIGSAALFLQTDYDRGTKDSDILETPAISSEISQKLRALAGKDSPLFKKYRVYMDIVKVGIPFLPQKPIFHTVPELKGLTNFSVQVLDIVDVAVSKLKPFRPRDVEDIEFLVSKKLISHKKLLERFHMVVDFHSMDARAEDLPKFVQNLNRVERDMLFVPESKIDLPDWI
jgi:hypothetical protein